jgi:uncharacterized membrane protein (DUF373 family)
MLLVQDAVARGRDASEIWLTLAGRLYPALVRALTSATILVLCLWMLSGAVNMLLELPKALSGGWATIAEHTIVNSLIMLALLEVIRTLQAYLQLGRVRVTFILDTALVVLIGELMGLWFREYAPEEVVLGVGVIVALVILRIVADRTEARAARQGWRACGLTTRFSPHARVGEAPLPDSPA